MSKYKPKGWRGEPHRHYLAAKGIRTRQRYFQEKNGIRQQFEDIFPSFVDEDTPESFREIETPSPRTAETTGISGSTTGGTVVSRVRGRQKAEAELAREQTGKRTVNQALDAIDSGRFAPAVKLLTQGGLQQRDVDAIQAALSSKALQQAQAGVPINDKLLELIPKQDAAEIQEIRDAAKAERDRRLRGPGAEAVQQLKETVVGKVGEAAAAPGEEFTEGLRFLGGAAEASEKGLGKNALLNRIDNEKGVPADQVDSDLADSPLVRTNAFIGNEEQQRPLSQQFDNIPSLNSNFDFLEEDGRPPTNPVFQDVQASETQMEKINRQVDELYRSRRDLADVDLSSYDKGNKAFEDGDREELISAINDLKAEETTLQDRFNLVETARQNVKSVPNFSDAFERKSGNAIFEGGLFSSGAKTLAEQTDKINEVRQDIVNANEKAFSRRVMLENRLKRLDSTVPPETTVPEKVDRFKKQDSGFGSLFSNNPLVGGNK